MGLPFRSTDGTWTDFAARARIFLVNKKRVPASEMPRSIRDLADPRWKGQVAMANPLFGTMTMHVAALFAAWGEERARLFLESLKANNIRIASSNGEVKRLVVGGEVAFGIADTDDGQEAVQEGAPVEVIYPDQGTGQDGLGTLVMPTTVVLISGGPHPEPDASLEEAARLVASPWRVVTRILLPAARPALVLSAIIVFALSLSELGVPMFLRVDVFTAAVFARLGGIAYAPGEAFVLVLPLVPIALLLLFIERRFVGVRSFAVAGLRGMSRSPLPLGRWRPAAAVAGWSLAVLAIAPIAALAARAALGRGFTQLSQWLGQAPWTSLISAVVAATAIAALALVLGHAAARRLRGATSLDALAMLAFVLPASVLGVGLIAVWNRPATGALYGSMAILVIGYVARYSIVGIRTVASVILQSPVHLEEAAAASGAGFARRLFRIVLPVNARGIAFAWLLALVFCLRDLESAVLFYPPGGEPLTVRLFTLEANGPTAVVAALAVTQAAMTAAALALGALLLPKGRCI